MTELLLFASAWAFGGTDACLREARAAPFDGLEAPPPLTLQDCRALEKTLRDDGIPYIAEICTGGSYAPASSVPEERHWDDFRDQSTRAVEAGARLLTCLAGSDSWPETQAIDFFGRALDLGRSLGAELSFETHRSRPTFHPWATGRFLHALPELRLTCDLSHWCVVCERLVDDDAVLSLVLSRATHLHARVGYAQGPQVPDPRAPEYAVELAAHESWWRRAWTAARDRASPSVTMTPEFGPDGYLQHTPFTKTPAADLGEVNRWMAGRLRAEFGD